MRDDIREIKSIKITSSGVEITTYRTRCSDHWQMLRRVVKNSYVAQNQREYDMLLRLAKKRYVVRDAQPGIKRACWFITDAGRAALESEGDDG
jgi:hypothetical protein